METEHELILGKIDRLEGRVNEMDKALSISGVILEKNNTVLDKLSDVIEKVSDAMSSIKLAMVDMQNEIKCNALETTNLQAKVGVLEQKIDASDSKSKIDFVKLIKDNFIPALAILYLVLELTGVIGK